MTAVKHDLDSTFSGERPWRTMAILVAIRGGGVVLQLLVNVLVARMFGPAAIGIYQLYNSWMTTIADTAGMGLPVTTIREVSRLQAQGRYRDASWLIRRTVFMTIGALGVFICAVVLLGPWVLSHISKNHEVPVYLWLALAGSLWFAVFRILVEGYKAEGRPLFAVAIESLILPLVLVLLIALCMLLGDELIDEAAAVSHLAALVLVTLAVWAIRPTPSTVNDEPGGCAPQPVVIQSDTMAIWGGVLVNVALVNLPFYILPFFADLNAIGQFAVCYRIVAVATTLLVVMSAWYGPRIAAAQANADSDEVARKLRQARLFSTAVYLPFLAVCVLFGSVILSLFGSDFAASTDLLITLALGQLVNAATGVPGLHLNMVGKGTLEFQVALAAVVAGVPLCIAGAGLFGVVGLAAGFSVTIALKNIGSLVLSNRVLRARPGTLPRQNQLAVYH